MAGINFTEILIYVASGLVGLGALSYIIYTIIRNKKVKEEEKKITIAPFLTEKKLADKKLLDKKTFTIEEFEKHFFEKYQVLAGYIPVEDNQSLVSRTKIKMSKSLNKTSLVGIHMELNNGKFISFYAKEEEGGFYFQGKFYIFDIDMRQENLTSKMFEYYFHEDWVLPIRRKFDVTELTKYIAENGIPGLKKGEIPYATNPKSIALFIKNKIIQAMLTGGELQMLLIILIIGVVINILVSGAMGAWLHFSDLKTLLEQNIAMKDTINALVTALTGGKQ